MSSTLHSLLICVRDQRSNVQSGLHGPSLHLTERQARQALFDFAAHRLLTLYADDFRAVAYHFGLSGDQVGTDAQLAEALTDLHSLHRREVVDWVLSMDSTSGLDAFYDLRQHDLPVQQPLAYA